MEGSYKGGATAAESHRHRIARVGAEGKPEREFRTKSSALDGQPRAAPHI
jgi:hypothetical protein